jgi:hypothetical protein
MPEGVPIHSVWSIHGSVWIQKTGSSCYHEIMVTAEKLQNKTESQQRYIMNWMPDGK